MDDPERPPQSDPAAAIAALKAQGAPDEAIHAYLTQHLGLQEVSDPMAKYHRAYQTGRLQKNTAEKNEADKVSLLGGTVDAAVEAPETFAAGVPGAKLLISGARTLFNPGLTLAQNQRDVNEETEAAPGASKLTRLATTAAHLGGALSTAAIPGMAALSPVKAGALIGGADQLLNNDPDSGVGNRLLRTGAGAAGGAALGKVAQLGGTLLKARGAPDLDANMVARETARSTESQPLYEKFRQLGDLGSSPKMQELLDLPIVKTALKTVKGESDVLAKLPDTDASVLDAVYKRVGSKAFRLKHGYGPSTARDALGDEMDNLSGGLYSPALEAFGTGSAEMDAVKRGAATLKNAASTSGTPLSQLLKRSPAALQKWASSPTRTPEELEAAGEGIFGQLHQSPKLARAGFQNLKVPLPWPSRALQEAPELLDAVGAGSKVSPGFLAALNSLVPGR